MYKHIIEAILNHSKFYLNYQITKGKITLIINNLFFYEFDNRSEVDEVLKELNQVAPNQFLNFPEDTHFINMQYIDFIKISDDRRIRVNLQNKSSHGVNINSLSVDDELLLDELKLTDFLSFITNSKVPFLPYEYKQGTVKMFINVDNIYKTLKGKSDKEGLIDPITKKKKTVENTSIIFKGLTPNVIEYVEQHKIPFADLLMDFKKSQVIKKSL